MPLSVHSLGQGQAYGCNSDDFRLNARADQMQLWPDDPDHFAIWAAKNISDDPDSQTAVGNFHRRGDFAIYMADQLASCAGISDIQRHESLAESITHNSDKDCSDWWASLTDGTRVATSSIVIASGNPAPNSPWPNHRTMHRASSAYLGAVTGQIGLPQTHALLSLAEG